jgi:hypothetical protein
MATPQVQLTSSNNEGSCNYLIPLLTKDLESSAHDDDQERVYDLVGFVCLGHAFLRNLFLEIPSNGETVTIIQPSPTLRRLHCFNWLYDNMSNPHIHYIMRVLLIAQTRNPGSKSLWRFEASDEEIDAALTLVNAQQRPVLSQLLQQRRKDLCLWENLAIFDSLGSNRCDLFQKGVLFTLIINDLKVARSPLYANYLQGFNWSSFVQFLAYATSGLVEYLEQPEMKYMAMPELLRKPLSDYFVEC